MIKLNLPTLLTYYNRNLHIKENINIIFISTGCNKVHGNGIKSPLLMTYRVSEL